MYKLSFWLIGVLTICLFTFLPTEALAQKKRQIQLQRAFLEQEYAMHIEPNAEIISITPTELIQKDVAGKVTHKIYYFDTKEIIKKFVYYENEAGQKHGKFLSYGRNDELLSEIEYVNGKQHGEHKTYASGKLFSIGNCDEGEKTGIWKYYSDSVLISEGAFQNGLYIGQWKNYLPTGDLAYSTTYTDIGNDSIRFHRVNPAGDVIHSCALKKKWLNLSLSQIEQSLETDTLKAYTFVNPFPQFPGGHKALSKFFRKKIKYPSIAKELGIDGNQKLLLTIEKDGKVSNVECIECTGECFLQEIKRVVSLMPKWKPGIRKGQIVRSKYGYSVSFNLK